MTSTVIVSSSCLIRVDQIFFSPRRVVDKLLRDACKHSKFSLSVCTFPLTFSNRINEIFMMFEALKNFFYYSVIESLLGSASEEEEDDDNSTASSVMKHHSIHSSLPPAPGETNNNSLPHSDISSSIGQVRNKRNLY